jgi:hypothetical protein
VGTGGAHVSCQARKIRQRKNTRSPKHAKCEVALRAFSICQQIADAHLLWFNNRKTGMHENCQEKLYYVAHDAVEEGGRVVTTRLSRHLFCSC